MVVQVDVQQIDVPGAIAALYEFAPREEGEGAEVDNQNGQAVEEELVEA